MCHGKQAAPKGNPRGSAIRAGRGAPAAGRTANTRKTNTSQHAISLPDYPRLYQVPRLTMAFQLNNLRRGKTSLKQKQKRENRKGCCLPPVGRCKNQINALSSLRGVVLLKYSF